MTTKPIQKIVRILAALSLTVIAVSIFTSGAPASADPTASASASIGVQVDQPTTTTLAPTTTTPATTPPAPSAPTPAVTTPPTTAAPVTTTAPPTTDTTMAPVDDTLPEVLPAPISVTPSHSGGGFSAQVRSAAKTTKDLVSGISSGKPVADVVQAVLPQSVATVVVPAVRTASTFVFPIGLAAAVIAFLALQQRIDSGDPKLSAAPMAHDDDLVEFS